MIKELARNQIEVYWQHDLQNFEKVSTLIEEMYIKLGYERNVSLRAGKFIAEAYNIADKAEVARREKDSQLELEMYTVAYDILRETEKLLNYRENIAKYQINWWRYFRHKQLVFAFLNLFIQHLKPQGVFQIYRALLMTIVLTKIGLAHNKRDKVKAIQNAERYWQLLINAKTKGCPYLG